MYQKLKLKNKDGILLKQHHHVNLIREFLLDCGVWRNFLTTKDLRICRPFLDLTDQTGQVILLATDAAKKSGLGMGAICQNRWMAEKWNDKFLACADPSIEFLELYVLTVAILTWTKFPELPLKNNHVTVFCDNQAVVSIVNNLASSCRQCRKLVRLLALCGIKQNLRVFVRYVRSNDNWLSDALSRMNFSKFWELAPKGMMTQPDKPLSSIFPPERIWDSEDNYLNIF